MVSVRLHGNAPMSVAATVTRAKHRIYTHSFSSRPATSTLSLRLRPHLKHATYFMNLQLASTYGTATLSRRFRDPRLARPPDPGYLTPATAAAGVELGHRRERRLEHVERLVERFAA